MADTSAEQEALQRKARLKALKAKKDAQVSVRIELVIKTTVILNEAHHDAILFHPYILSSPKDSGEK